MSIKRGSWYLTGSVTQRKKRKTPNVVDQYGNDVYAETTVTLGPPQRTGDVNQGVLIEPRLAYGTEDTAGQEHVGSGLDLYCANPEADIQPTDEFLYDGVWWQVDGPTRRYRNSRLSNDFCHVNLERITG